MRVEDGSFVHIGDILGQTSRMTIKQRDITGGLPRVQDLFEARVPKDKAKISDIDGIVTIGGLKKTGRDIFVTPPNGLSFVTERFRVFYDEDKNQYIAVLSDKAVYSENDGKVSIIENNRKKIIQVAKRNQKPVQYPVPRVCKSLVKEGESVKKGTLLR